MKYDEIWNFDYNLPKELIAQRPSIPPDTARLMIYDRDIGTLREGVFLDLPDYLPTDSLLIFNDTKVIPVRIFGRKRTGGRLEVFFLESAGKNTYRAMLDRYIKPGEEIVLEGGGRITVTAQEGKYFLVRSPLSYSELISYLEKHGHMPIPPYIEKPDSEKRLRTEYQTIFAREYGSSAAPTASLHFTERLLERIRTIGVGYDFVTLHVGLGTFAPLTEENFRTGRLHTERFSVTAELLEKIAAAKKSGRKIIAVGTTVVRTLESLAAGKQGETDLFITPGYKFKTVDGMVTNFHLPRSSLLLMISAFIGSREKTLDLYRVAVSRQYRFFSFGDGMLIL